MKECTNYRTVKSCQKLSKRRSVQNYPASRGLPLAGAKQAGFRKDSGTRYHFFKLRMIIQKCREFNKDLYMCFIDCSRAFDYVSHSQLWGTLSKMGFPEREINLGKVLYTGQETSICTNCGNTEWFKIKRGVRQGCILSPCSMFNWDLRQYLGMRGVGGKKEEACYGDEQFVEVETHVVNILNEN